MATIDYKYVDWSRMQSSQSNVSFENQHRLSVGGRYTLGNVYRNPVSILLGTGINNSYIVIQRKRQPNITSVPDLTSDCAITTSFLSDWNIKARWKFLTVCKRKQPFPVPEYYFLRANLPRQDTIKCHKTEVIKIAVHLKKRKLCETLCYSVVKLSYICSQNI